jgi:hypothetical protein
MSMIKCSNCIAWEPLSEQHGKCHGNIPSANLIPTQGQLGQQTLAVVTYWPETRVTDGCMKGSNVGDNAYPPFNAPSPLKLVEP